VLPEIPEIIPVDVPLWFETTLGMLAADQLARFARQTEGKFVSEGMDPDSKSLISRRYVRLAELAETLARFNIGALTMQSGLGIGLGLSNEQLAELATQAGLDRVPVLFPLLYAYSGGTPVASEGDAWNRLDADRLVTPATIGSTLSAQAGVFAHYRDSVYPGERLVGLLMARQMAMAVDVFNTSLLPAGEGELRAGYRRSDEDEKAFVADEDPATLFGAALLLKGALDARAAGVDGSAKMANSVWRALLIHYDQELGSFAQDGKLSAVDAMAVSLALAALAGQHGDLGQAAEAGRLLAAHTALIAEKLVAEEGYVHTEYDLENQDPKGGAKTLTAAACAVRALVTHQSGLASAERVAGWMDANLWDEARGLYRPTADWFMSGRYTPMDLAAVVGGLGHLALHRGSEEQKALLDRVARFMESVAVQGGLQAGADRGVLVDDPQATFIGEGAAADGNLRRFMPVPSRRYRDATIETGLGGRPLAPVLASEITMNFTPLEADKLQALADTIDYRVDRFAPRTPIYLEPERVGKLGARAPFDTAQSMQAAAQMITAAPQLARVAKRTDNAFVGLPSQLGRTATELAEIGRGSLMRMTMQSQNGVPLKISDAELAELAGQAGLDQPPPVKPISVPFATGRPDFRQGLAGGWDVTGVDRRVSTLGLAQTMLAQSAYLAQKPNMPLDRFLGAVTALSLAEAVSFVDNALSAGEPLPAGWRVAMDSASQVLGLEPLADAASEADHLALLAALETVAVTEAVDDAVKTRARALAERLKATAPEGDWLTAAASQRQSLASQAAPIYLAATAGDMQRALDLADDFDRRFWSKRLHSYLADEDQEHQVNAGALRPEISRLDTRRYGDAERTVYPVGVRTTRYMFTADDIGTTVAALAAVLPAARGEQARRLADHLSTFTTALLQGAGTRPADMALEGFVSDRDHVRGVDLFLVDRERSYPGDRVAYIITVNNGRDTGTLADDERCRDFNDLQVQDTLPRGARYIAGSSRIDGIPKEPRVNGRDLVWTLGRLVDGQGAVITFRVNLADKAFGSRYQNVAAAGDDLCRDTTRDVAILGQGARIKGTLFVDADGDGRKGPGDRAVPRIRVILDENRAIDTDNTGTFSFEDLVPGVYQVRIDLTDLPEGLYVTDDPVRTVVVGDGQTYILDIGLVRYQRLMGVVFDDRNGNGVRDADEPGVPRVRVVIEGLPYAELGAYSAADGSFRIDGVPEEASLVPVIDRDQPYLEESDANLRLEMK
jgi:uncharacterized repeat protein (TIGR01451 family)